jgi:hypothetical protein
MKTTPIKTIEETNRKIELEMKRLDEKIQHFHTCEELTPVSRQALATCQDKYICLAQLWIWINGATVDLD